MPRIVPMEPSSAAPEARAELDWQLAANGRLTNMKRTLAHSGTALHALMTWYPLKDRVVPFLGERATTLFAHAISARTDCLICSTHFRRTLIERGDRPDEPQIDERERAVIEFGRCLVAGRNRVPDELYARLARWFSPAQIVTLTAFGALMIATNVFNNALAVDLDDYLKPYTRS